MIHIARWNKFNGQNHIWWPLRIERKIKKNITRKSKLRPCEKYDDWFSSCYYATTFVCAVHLNFNKMMYKCMASTLFRPKFIQFFILCLLLFSHSHGHNLNSVDSFYSFLFRKKKKTHNFVPNFFLLFLFVDSFFRSVLCVLFFVFLSASAFFRPFFVLARRYFDCMCDVYVHGRGVYKRHNITSWCAWECFSSMQEWHMWISLDHEKHSLTIHFFGA